MYIKIERIVKMEKTAKEGLYFLPLGGADEIGMNMYAYGCDGKWIVVDAGYGFLNDDYPGMDMCFASPEFLEEFQEDVEGIFITHAHEDHMGAVAQIWPALQCPIYATPFAMALIKERLSEFNLVNAPELKIVQPGDIIKTSVFSVEFVPLVHSVPQTCGLYIKTPYANVFHATDWRFDDGLLPMLQTDWKRLKEIGEEGVSMFVADTTNISVENRQPSEAEIRQNLLDLIPTIEGGLIVTCFASNLMRLESIVLAADKAGRTPVAMGKTLVNNIKIAKECGYFADLPQTYKPEQAKDITQDKTLYICTGSQGNYRSALSMIAKGESKYVTLSDSDTIIFSSKIIPGNEQKIERLQDKMRQKGVRVITEDMMNVHTSGHCSRQEIKQMYDLLKPQIVFPVHGDKAGIDQHCAFALENGIKQVCSAKNGDLFLIRNNRIEKEEEVFSEILALDRGRVVSLTSELLRKRKQIAYNCVMFISLVINKDNRVADLQISSPDILEEKDWQELIEGGQAALIEQINKKLQDAGGLNANVKEAIRGRIRRFVFKNTDVKPLTIMHVYQTEL